MTQDEFLGHVATLLDNAGIPFMVTGSLGSSIHGQPRATQDVDLVIDPTREQLDRFLDALSSHFYFSRTAAQEALFTWKRDGKPTLLCAKTAHLASKSFGADN